MSRIIKTNVLILIFTMILSITLFHSSFPTTNKGQLLKNNSCKFSDVLATESTSKTEPLKLAPENTFVGSEIGTLDRSFQYTESCDSNTDLVSVDNCEDWILNTNFNFSNIRSEKFANGDAENEETFWNELSGYDYSTLTREDDPCINGDYSWCFDIKSSFHGTMACFDPVDGVSLNGNSTIFSLSYSLLETNSTADSAVYVYLQFARFDLYIYLWFKGNPEVLGNTTGYADLLVNGTEFGGETAYYSLNVTALALEKFGAKPQKLQCLFLATWASDNPYFMDFLIDDLSLTDLSSPTNVGLQVNSKAVVGEVGLGTVSIQTNPSETIEFQITSSETIFWSCHYQIAGSGMTSTSFSYNFVDFDFLLWSEKADVDYLVPSAVNKIVFTNWILKEWTVEEVLFNSGNIYFATIESNTTHKQIEIEVSPIIGELEFRYLSDNFIDEIFLSSAEITHADKLSVSAETRMYLERVDLCLLDSNNNNIYANSNITDANGFVSFQAISFTSDLTRGKYSIVLSRSSGLSAGIGISEFNITTIPTITIPITEKVTVYYRQAIEIVVDYLDLESNVSISPATVAYEWEYGSGMLDQNSSGYYIGTIFQEEAIPGIYTVSIQSSKNSCASSGCEIKVIIIAGGVSLLLDVPQTAVPNEVISFSVTALNNQSEGMSCLPVSFSINDQVILQTVTNETGIAEGFYQIPNTYLNDSIVVSCVSQIDDFVIASTSRQVTVEVFELERATSLGTPTQCAFTNETVVFLLQIVYPSVGRNWIADIPTGFNPLSAKVVTDNENISAAISPLGYITWERIITSPPFDNDFLLLELSAPQPSRQVVVSRTAITINISITTNYVPYSDLELIIPLEGDWFVFGDWVLYVDNVDVSEQYEFEVTETNFRFKISSSTDASSLRFQIVGERQNLVQIAPTTILLGVGTVVLTAVSTVLLIKKRSNVSLDVQL